MKRKNLISTLLCVGILVLVVFSCSSSGQRSLPVPDTGVSSVEQEIIIPELNQAVIDTMLKYGPGISPTYQKAVCTELVIEILEKFHKLNSTDKSRIRIITNDDIQSMLRENADVPKGVYYALTAKGVGMAIDNIEDVIPGDFVQFWTTTWGHCGVVKEIDVENGVMTLYSSFPSTDGYGEQKFRIPEYAFFVRLK